MNAVASVIRSTRARGGGKYTGEGRAGKEATQNGGGMKKEKNQTGNGGLVYMDKERDGNRK